MKMKLKAEIIDEKGKVITKEIETEIPEVTEFGDPENFYEVFNRFEKPVIEARNQLGKEITEAFLGEAVKASKKGANAANVKLKERSDESQ